jgi:hypothetical protein
MSNRWHPTNHHARSQKMTKTHTPHHPCTEPAPTSSRGSAATEGTAAVAIAIHITHGGLVVCGTRMIKNGTIGSNAPRAMQIECTTPKTRRTSGLTHVPDHLRHRQTGPGATAPNGRLWAENDGGAIEKGSLCRGCRNARDGNLSRSID